jgi:uncharacterized protein (DUF433 family)
MSAVASAQIELRETRSGESKAYVAGTRVSVQDVYVAHELVVQKSDEIVAAYPHLTLAQVHAALAYCFEHLPEIRRQFQAEADFVDELRKRTGPGPLARKLSRHR